MAGVQVALVVALLVPGTSSFAQNGTVTGRVTDATTGAPPRSKSDFRSPRSRPDRFGVRGRDGSPVHHLAAGLPPTLILHGKADTTVPYADVDRYCSAARTFGNQCQLIGYEGATHGFFNADTTNGQWYSETLLEADRYLIKTGYLRAKATK